MVVYGDIFGGRIDNQHRVISAYARSESDRLVVEFNEGETLEIWDPRHASISAREFRISSASRVRWDWFYYGRPKTAENRFFIEHVRIDDIVVGSTNATGSSRTFTPTIEVSRRRNSRPVLSARTCHDDALSSASADAEVD